MISGAVLLGKEESLKDVWIKRVLRIAIIILGVNFVILVYRRDFDVFSWPRKILHNEVNSYLEFLYIYIVAMIFLPLLRKAVHYLSSKIIWGLFILDIALKIVLAISNKEGGVYSSNLYFLFAVIDAIIYMFIGYWVENIIDISKDNNYIDICLSIIVGISVVSYFVAEVYLLDSLVIASLFLLVKILFYKYPPSEKSVKIISYGGSLTFGVYLLSGPIQILGFAIKTMLWKAHSLSSLIPAIIGSVVLFILYGLIVVIFKWIPGLGRIVEWFI